MKADSPIKIAEGHDREEHHRLLDQRLVLATTSWWRSARNSAPRRNRPRPAGRPATFTSVMTGQIDIGWAAPPFGLKEIKEGKIRIIARGSDMPSLKGQTVRAMIVNAECAGGASGRDHALRQRLSRGGGLDVCRSQGDRDVCREGREPVEIFWRSR